MKSTQWMSLPRSSPPSRRAVALLDAVPDATAVLDTEGMIVAVNRAWRMFGADNGGRPDRTGVGLNYFDVCMRSTAEGCPDAAAAAAALRSVLDGGSVESELQYPCASPTVARWFVMRATQIRGLEPGLLVSHMNITRRKLAEEDLLRRSTEDPLTGLANRSLFTKRLTAALTPRPGRVSQSDVGLLYMDLDGFKLVNDTYGHAAGDEVLQAVAGRLKLVTRPQDTVARVGGDEFAMVAPRITAEGLATLVDRIGTAVAEPLLVHGRPMSTGVSVGTYLAAAGEGVSASLQRADTAMYAVKRGANAGR